MYTRWSSRLGAATLVAAVILTQAARADDWYWSGGCGGAAWWAICAGDPCENGQPLLWNNWDESACAPEQPPFPGAADTVHIGSLAILDAAAAQITDLYIGAGAELSVQNGGHLTVHGPLIDNAGELWLRWGGYLGNGILTVAGTTTLTGGGELRSDGGTINGGTLANAADSTIRGTNLTINAGLANAGTLTSELAGALVLREAAKFNDNLLRCTPSAYLDICTTVVQGAAGRIRADGGDVRLYTGCDIHGGLLESTGAAVLQADANAAVLRDVHNTGTLQVGNGGVFALHNTLVNDGLLRVYFGGYWGNGILRAETAPVTLSGAGEVRLEGGTLDGLGFVQAAGHTLRAWSGTIQAPFANSGLIVADQNGGVLNLQSSAKDNHGAISVRNGATLNLSVPIEQFGTEGTITADAGTVRLQTGAAITGGTLATDNGGQFVADANACTLLSVTNDGLLRVGNGARLAVQDSLVNDGILEVYFGGYWGRGIVDFLTNTTLSGVGEVQLKGATFISDAGALATIAAGQNLHGYDADFQVALDHAGTLSADTAGGVVGLRGAPKLNRGLLAATNGGYLDLLTAIEQVEEGQIRADGGTVRLYNGAAITGGTLTTENGGQFVLDANGGTLTNVVNDGLLRVGNGGRLSVHDNLENNGVLEVYYGGYWGRGIVDFVTDTTLSGVGEVLLQGAALTSDSGALATVAAGQNLHGYNTDIHVALDHAGTLSADSAGGVIGLRGAPKLNRGLLAATNGGFLDVLTTIEQLADGQIRADGGTVRLYTGSAITGGTLATDSGGQFVLDANGSTFTEVTSDGLLRVGNAGTLTVTERLTNNGMLEVYYGGYWGGGHVQLDGDVTFDGTGVVALASGNIATANGGTLHNGAGHTLTGAGPVQTTLINSGVVAPGNGVGTLPVTPAYTHGGTAELCVELRRDGACDRLAASGAATLAGGTLRVVPNGAAVQAGQQFVVLTAGALTGEFASVTGPGIYTVSYANNQVTLTVVHGPGDVNCDGTTGFGDINPFILALTNPSAYAAAYPACDIRTADTNGDGTVNFGDINPFVALLTGN